MRFVFVGTLPTFIIQQKPDDYDWAISEIQKFADYDADETDCVWAILERENAFATTVLPKAWDLNYFQAKFNV